MKRNLEEQYLIKIAGYLGIVQALAWTALSLVCIIEYLSPGLPNFDNGTYFGKVNLYLYMFLLFNPKKMDSASSVAFPGQSLSPKVVHGFAWVYLFLSIFWLVVSISVRCQKTIDVRRITAWSHLTLLISVFDLITIIILGVDYNQCFSITYGFYGVSDGGQVPGLCENGILPALAIVARGGTLWVVNVVLALVFIKIRNNIKAELLLQAGNQNMYHSNYPHPENALMHSGGYNQPSQHMQYPPHQQEKSGSSLNHPQAEYFVTQ